MLFGNLIGGAFVVIFHLLVVTNIDNVLRPILVPRQAKLDPALMLLAVFSGIAMFGFWGLIIGPVVMIIVVTTISVYLAVFKGVPLDEPDEPEPKRRNGIRGLFRRLKPKAVTAKPVPPPAEK
jgi:predicted PurR-regulated permease PerM